MKMLKWNQLEDDTEYVLDLVQRPDGCRMICLREAESPRNEHGVLETERHLGVDLRRWAHESVLTQHVRLQDGSRFVEEAHGGWMTDAEFHYWRLSSEEKELVPESKKPWINGLPPVFPSV